MKLPNKLMVALIVLIGVVPDGRSQFTSGSTGAYGPISVTTDTTLDLPPDGIFHCTTITIQGGRTLKFRRNAMNTPVYLLATGDVNIAGIIDVSGKSGSNVSGGEGGPGGFDGGNPGTISTVPGAGYGPGAGKGGAPGNLSESAGAGSYATLATGNSVNKGNTYGNALLLPAVGGSGGGGSTGTPGLGGGGGGGGLLIASSTRVDFSGTIYADGAGSASGTFNGGSGGAVRIVAPIVAGSGTIRTFGASGGGSGRIRVDTANRSNVGFGFNPSGIATIGALMIVFPTPNPRLDIIEAAGTAIPPGSGPVFVQLPFGSDPNRSIRVQARDFNEVVPITVQLTPENGAPLSYQAQIDNKASNPAQTTVNVTLPVNVQVSVNVWTR